MKLIVVENMEQEAKTVGALYLEGSKGECAHYRSRDLQTAEGSKVSGAKNYGQANNE